jgi:hypothetical protein
MPEPFRITPQLPAAAMQTYAIRSPSDREIVATCKQVGCEGWRNGWETVVNEATDLGRRQAAYIRTESRRTFREQKTVVGLTVFRFESGQRCFAEHKTRPEIFIVRDGDWRGNPTGRRRVHASPADWVEDFALHQQGVAEAVKRG